jgi:hypothetical protein
MFVQRSSDVVPTAYYPVGYSAFLGTLYRVFGQHLVVAAIGGACVSALSVTLSHRIAWRFAPGWRACFATVMLAFLPGQILFAGATMTEPLFGTLLALAAYLLVRDADRTSRGALIGAAIALAAATYVRPQAVLLAPLLPLARPNAFANGWRGRWLGSALVTAIALACVAPWSVRNCRDLDGCAFVSTNGGSNFAIGAVPRGNGRFFFLDARDGCAGVQGEVARDRCWRSVALHAIGEDPWRWIKLAFVKLDHTLSYEAFPVGYLREGLRAPTPAGSLAIEPASSFARAHLPLDDTGERRWRRVLTFPWRILLALAFLALVPIATRRFDSPSARVALLVCVGTLATHVVFFGGDRYHLPLAPLVAVLAAGAFRALPGFGLHRRTRAVVRNIRVRDLERDIAPFASL